MSIFRKDRFFHLFIIAGLATLTGSVFVRMFRYTQRSIIGGLDMEGNKQASLPSYHQQVTLTDRVDWQSEASFPASDSPSWSGSIAGGSH